MKSFLTIISGLLAIIMLTRCIPDPLDIAVDQSPQKLVISSQIIPDRFMAVTVTKSFSALEKTKDDSVKDLSKTLIEKVLVKDAIVTIHYDNITDTLREIDELPGMYFSVNTLQIPNSTYTLNIYDAKSEQRVSATSTMLPRVTLGSAKTFQKDTVLYLDYSINDPAAEKNWYVLNVVKLQNPDIKVNLPTATPKANDILKNSRYKKPSDLDLNSLNNFNSLPFDAIVKSVATEIIDDKDLASLSNRELKLPLTYSTDTLAVVLSNISEGYYNFLKAGFAQTSLSSKVTKEPITYPSNVNNGYGYFNTHNPDIKFINF